MAAATPGDIRKFHEKVVSDRKLTIDLCLGLERKDAKYTAAVTENIDRISDIFDSVYMVPPNEDPPRQDWPPDLDYGTFRKRFFAGFSPAPGDADIRYWLDRAVGTVDDPIGNSLHRQILDVFRSFFDATHDPDYSNLLVDSGVDPDGFETVDSELLYATMAEIACEHREKLEKITPEMLLAEHLLADSHRRVALILERGGKTEAAEAEYRLAITLYDAYKASYEQHADGNPERAFCYIEFAAILARTGRLAEAESLHRTGCAVMKKSWKLQPLDPGDCNALAWNLATSPIEQFRDPGLAVELAKNAVKLATQRGNFWNTLGVAHYRAGEWESAIKALEKSMELRKGGDAFDWFFLSMAHWQLGHKIEGRTWFDKSVAWAEKNQPKNGELVRFRAEAAKLVGIAEPQPSTGSTMQP